MYINQYDNINWYLPYILHVNELLSILLTVWLVVGLYDPTTGIFWEADNKTRSRFLFYFVSVVIGVTLIQVAMKPQSAEDTVASDNSETQRASPVERSPTVEQSRETDSSKILPVTELISHFSDLTDLQQEEWNNNHKWEYTVNGSGLVTEVGETNFISEDDSYPYEVTVELSEGTRAVVYFPEEKRDYVLNLDKGSDIDFVGDLKRIEDWGFWITAYVKYSEQKPQRQDSFYKSDAIKLVKRLKKRLDAEEFLTNEQINYDDGDSGLFFTYRKKDDKLGAAIFNISEETVQAILLPFRNEDGIYNVSLHEGQRGGIIVYFDYIPRNKRIQTRFFWNLNQGSLHHKKIFTDSGEAKYSINATNDEVFSKNTNIPLYLIR